MRFGVDDLRVRLGQPPSDLLSLSPECLEAVVGNNCLGFDLGLGLGLRLGIGLGLRVGLGVITR